MGDAERSRKGKMLRAYTKLHDIESNAATILVITRTLYVWGVCGVFVLRTIRTMGGLFVHFISFHFITRATLC